MSFWLVVTVYCTDMEDEESVKPARGASVSLFFLNRSPRKLTPPSFSFPLSAISSPLLELLGLLA